MSNKNRFKSNLIVTLFLLLTVGILQLANAQSNNCVSGNCNPNTYIYSTDPNTIEYDNMVSVFHSSMVREADGTVKVWGQGVAQNGTGNNGNVLTTSDPAGVLHGDNYGSGTNRLTGTVLKFTGASSSNNQQFAVLTTNGLYIWGDQNVLVPNVSNVASGSFRKVAIGTYNIGGTKADGLPDGVNPSDVKMMFGTRQGLAIVTCNGQAWVLTIHGWAYGDGATDSNGNDLLWHRVSTAANTPLQNVIAVRGAHRVFMALTSNGDIYTWGEGTRINVSGTAGNPDDRNYATLITKPSGVTPKMIGMTQSTGGKTYYLLATDGRLFSMGENNQQQLGWGGTTDSNVWGQVTASDNGYTIGSNVVWISPQEHDAGTQIQDNASINIITDDGKVWAWGNNSFGMLGYPTSTTNSAPGLMPGRVTGAYDKDRLNLSDIIMAVETGGHTTLLIKQCSKKFGYVGHRIRGSMADGTSTEGQETIYNFSQTGEVSICGAPTSPTVQNLQVCPTATGDLNDAILSSAPDGFYLEWWTTVNRAPGTQVTDTDILNAGPGTYYAFYIANTGPCEDPAYSKVIVTDDKPGCIVANDDTYGPFTGLSGGTTGSVLENDLFNNQSVDPDDITLTPGTPSYPGLVMNPDGTITVPPGTPEGTYTYPYTICLQAQPTYCDDAIATITVVAPEIVANDDSFGPFNGEDGGNTPSVLNNDTLNGSPVDPDDITLTPGTPSYPGLVMNPDGTITIPPGTPAGNYTYPYTICEELNPTNCDDAIATITVVAPEIVASDDSFGPFDSPIGGSTPSVLNNDTLNGSTVDPDDITLTPGTPSYPGLVMNPDGTITVPPGTPVGSYTYPYTICEELNPTNCDDAVATITVIVTVGCVNPDLKVILEGPFIDKGNGQEMTTKLNDLGYLPGQKPVTFFGTATPVGQPYNTAPWNYNGTEGDGYDKAIEGPKAGYTSDVTDWVLVSLRATASPSSTVCQKAALLHKDGTVEMVSGFDCCDINLTQKYYVVVEHRNHLIVMSHEKVSVVDNKVSYDFTARQSYRTLLGFGQRLVNGKFVMFAGNGDQVEAGSSIKDINAKDQDLWLINNGLNSRYNINDFELNGDVNVQDKNLWLNNNSIFTDVPR